MNTTIIKIINEVIIPVAGVAVSVAGAYVSYYAKKFYSKHEESIKNTEKTLQDKLGVETYNKDVSVVKAAVYSIEQQAKEFNWTGELKHSKVLEKIEGKTGLTDEEIFDLIKGFVLQVNSLKSAGSTTINATVQK